MQSTIPSVRRVVRPGIQLGPKDQGRAIDLEDFDKATTQEGYQYELIDGRIEVSHQPDYPHASIRSWLYIQLLGYSAAHPNEVNKIHIDSRVYVHRCPKATCPEPDLAVYRDFAVHLPPSRVHWRDVSPILVIEVVSPDNAEKDFERNVALYLEVPSIREYWILDQRFNPDYPSLLVYRRRGQRWQKPIAVAPGQTYTTRLLPGFELKLEAPEE